MSAEAAADALAGEFFDGLIDAETFVRRILAIAEREQGQLGTGCCPPTWGATTRGGGRS